MFSCFVVKALQPATSLDRTASAANSSRNTKSKFVSLSSAEGASRMTVQLPGRYTCECHGQRHALVNNCIECGRIVCAQVCVCVRACVCVCVCV